MKCAAELPRATSQRDLVPILSVRNLSTGYGKKQVLFDVNLTAMTVSLTSILSRKRARRQAYRYASFALTVMPGEIVLITGGNGSGKSTLLKAIYGLLPAWFFSLRGRIAVATSLLLTKRLIQLAQLQQSRAVIDHAIKLSTNIRPTYMK